MSSGTVVDEAFRGVRNFLEDPIHETEAAFERAGEDVFGFLGIGEEGTFAPEEEEVISPPTSADVIPVILSQQLEDLRRRRQDRTLTTGPLGVPDTPLATTALFGA